MHDTRNFLRTTITCKMNVQNSKESIRHRTIGMIIGGMKQKDVASSLEKPLRTVQRWWSRYNRGETLQHVPGAGRPSKNIRHSAFILSEGILFSR